MKAWISHRWSHSFQCNLHCHPRQIGVPPSSFSKPRVSLYYNNSVVVLVDFTPTPRLSADAFVRLLQDRLASPAGISLPVYYAPFVVTKIEPPAAVPALPPSPFEDNTPPSKTPLIAAAVCGGVAAILILWAIGFCFRIKTPKRPASMTSAGILRLHCSSHVQLFTPCSL